MNKKQYARVKSLYMDKVSLEVCIIAINEMSKNETESAVFITKFFNEMIINPLKHELETTRLELESWQRIEKEIRQPAQEKLIPRIDKEKEDESSNGA